ncbi:hypothetical protein CLOP_g10155 [Closterium sp. NIES-67]|nr:hypothetical protein CLOP_g10155 [Closterium sp. NIES-67]
MESERRARHEMEMKALTDSLSRIRHLRKKRSSFDASPAAAAVAHLAPSTPSSGPVSSATAPSPLASSASLRPLFRLATLASPSSAQSPSPSPGVRPDSLELRAAYGAPSHWDVRSWLPEGLAAAHQPAPATASRDDAAEQSSSARDDEGTESEVAGSTVSEGGDGAASEDVLRANERLMMHVAASRWASQGSPAQANADHRAPSPPRTAHDAGEADDERSDAAARFNVASGTGLVEARGKAEKAGCGGGKAEEEDRGEATSGAGKSDEAAGNTAEESFDRVVTAGMWGSARDNEAESDDGSWQPPDPTSRGLFGGSSAFFNPLADDVALNLRLSLDDDDEEENDEEEEEESFLDGGSAELGSREGASVGVSLAATDSGSEGWGKAGGGAGRKAGSARIAAARRELEEQRTVVERKWRESQLEMRRAARMAAALKATVDSIDCVDSPARVTASAALPAALTAPHHGSPAALPAPTPAAGAPAALALAPGADGSSTGGHGASGAGMGGAGARAAGMGCSRRALAEARRLRERLEGLVRRMDAQGTAAGGGSSAAGSEGAESEAESSCPSSAGLSWGGSSTTASHGGSSSGGSGGSSDASWLLKRKILRDAGEMAQLERTMARIAADVATTKDVSARMEGHSDAGGGEDDEGGTGGAQRKRERGEGGGGSRGGRAPCDGGSADDGTVAVLQALAARMEGEVERVREEQEAWRERAAVAEAEARSLRRQVQQRDHAGHAMSASLRAELDMLRASRERTRRRQLAERGAWRRAAYQLRAAIGGEQLAQIREVGEEGEGGGGSGSVRALNGGLQWTGEGEGIGGIGAGTRESGEGEREMEALTRALALVVATGAGEGSEGEEGGSRGGEGQLVAVRRMADERGKKSAEERGLESAAWRREDAGGAGEGGAAGGEGGGGGWMKLEGDEGGQGEGEKQQEQAKAGRGGLGVKGRAEDSEAASSTCSQPLPPPPSSVSTPSSPPPLAAAASAVAAAAAAAAAAAPAVPQLPARRVAAPAAHGRKAGGGMGKDCAQGGMQGAGRRVGARKGEVRSSISAGGAILRRNGWEGERGEAEGGEEGRKEDGEERRRGKVRRVGSEGEELRNAGGRVRRDGVPGGGGGKRREGEVRRSGGGGEEGRGDGTGAASACAGSPAGVHLQGSEGKARLGRCEEGGEAKRERGGVAAGEQGGEVVGGVRVGEVVWEVARVIERGCGEKGAEGSSRVGDEGGRESGEEVAVVGERGSGQHVEREGEVRERQQGEGQSRRQQEEQMQVRESLSEGVAVVSPFAAEQPFRAERASAGGEWMRRSVDSGVCCTSHEWPSSASPAPHQPHSTPASPRLSPARSPPNTSPSDASPFSFPCIADSPSSTAPPSPCLSPHPSSCPAPTPTPWGSPPRPPSSPFTRPATSPATSPGTGPVVQGSTAGSTGSGCSRGRAAGSRRRTSTSSSTERAASSRHQTLPAGVLPPPTAALSSTAPHLRPPSCARHMTTGRPAPSGPWLLAVRCSAVERIGARWRAAAAAALCRGEEGEWAVADGAVRVPGEGTGEGRGEGMGEGRGEGMGEGRGEGVWGGLGSGRGKAAAAAAAEGVDGHAVAQWQWQQGQGQGGYGHGREGHGHGHGHGHGCAEGHSSLAQ